MTPPALLRLTPLALALALAACAGAPLPGHLLDPERSPHPDCPPARFVVAVGSSRTGRDDAEARARAAVVRRLGSEIEVATNRMVELSRKDGVVSSERSLKESFKEQTEFKHGELVSIVGAPEQQGDQTFALACLDRSKAAAALRRDLDKPLASFDEAAGRAELAGARDEHAGFAAAYREASAVAPRLLPLLGQLHAVSGASSPAEERFRERWKQLVLLAQRVRGGVTVRLKVSGAELPPDVRQAVTEALRGAMVGLGLQTVVEEGGSCSAADRGAYEIKVDAQPGCRWGSLGHACQPKLGARAVECSTQRLVFDTSLAQGQLKGNDGREAEKALRKAFRELSAKTVQLELQKLLAAELPLAQADQ